MVKKKKNQETTTQETANKIEKTMEPDIRPFEKTVEPDTHGIEKTVEPALREFDNTKNYIATTGAKKGATYRAQIIWPIPQTDEEGEERYGKPLSFFVEGGVKEISHGPDFKALFTEGDVPITPERHKELQKLADAHRPGNRKPGANAAIKAAAAANIKDRERASNLGFADTDAMFAALEKMKAAGKI